MLNVSRAELERNREEKGRGGDVKTEEGTGRQTERVGGEMYRSAGEQETQQSYPVSVDVSFLSASFLLLYP